METTRRKDEAGSDMVRFCLVRRTAVRANNGDNDNHN
jgi:hypothetical protein